MGNSVVMFLLFTGGRQKNSNSNPLFMGFFYHLARANYAK